MHRLGHRGMLGRMAPARQARHRARLAAVINRELAPDVVPDGLIDALADAVGFDAIGSGTVDPDTLLPNRVWTRGLGCPVISLTDLRDVAPGRPSHPVAVLSD